MPLNNLLDVKCGIFDTHYRLTRHRDGAVTVRRPYIKWSDNCGNLYFTNTKVPAGKRADAIKVIFDADDGLCGPDPDCTPLEDLI